jgi:predicted phage terminase large subunit-like protein
MVSQLDNNAVEDAVRAELARRGLLDFAARVHPKWQSPRHIQYLASLLERVEAGEIQRLAISAPPGHGKSWLLQTFLAWFLGRDPRRRILAISASESLAKRNSRDAQALVTHDAWPFPDCELSTDSVLDWSTRKGGSVRAIGKGGVISGFRAELAIVDDLQADAGSDATRASDFEWFQGVLSTRLEPDGAAVVIQTRWHDSDAIGQIMESEAASQWKFINLPAIATDKDVLGRNPGDVLWPERWPLTKLEAKKAEVGGNVFASLYQGDPVPSGGLLFKPEWFEHRFDLIPATCAASKSYEEQLAERIEWNETGYRPENSAATIPTIRIMAVDASSKSTLAHDPTAIATIATDLHDFYIENVWIGRVNFPDLRRVVIEQYERFKPGRCYIETAANGQALIDELEHSTSLPIVGLTARDSKIARAESTTGMFEAGRVKFPRNAPWLQYVLSEYARFPAGRNDDAVDAVTWALLMAQDVVNRAIADAHYYAQRAQLNMGWMDR